MYILWFELHLRIKWRIQFWGGAGFSSSIVRRKTIVQLGSLGGDVSLLKRGSRAKPWKVLAILHFECQNIILMALNSHLSTFSWINFYTFESLGLWVWNPRPAYWLQNSSRYSTVFICPKEIFVLSQCIESWIHFQNIHSFAYQKHITLYTFWLSLK